MRRYKARDPPASQETPRGSLHFYKKIDDDMPVCLSAGEATRTYLLTLCINPSSTRRRFLSNESLYDFEVRFVSFNFLH